MKSTPTMEPESRLPPEHSMATETQSAPQDGKGLFMTLGGADFFSLQTKPIRPKAKEPEDFKIAMWRQ